MHLSVPKTDVIVQMAKDRPWSTLNLSGFAETV